MRRLLLVGLSLAAVLLLAAPRSGVRAAEGAPPAPRTVVLLRHAEKEPQPADPRDPALSEAGAARARELARLFGASGATRIFTSELARTRQTVAPLAEKLGLASEALPASKPEALLAALDALPAGAVAIVCGHSNTVPRVAALLGVELGGLVEERGTRMLSDEDYDRVFVVTRPAAGPAAVLELRYGAISSSGR